MVQVGNSLNIKPVPCKQNNPIGSLGEIGSVGLFCLETLSASGVMDTFFFVFLFFRHVFGA